MQFWFTCCHIYFKNKLTFNVFNFSGCSSGACILFMSSINTTKSGLIEKKKHKAKKFWKGIRDFGREYRIVKKKWDEKSGNGTAMESSEMVHKACEEGKVSEKWPSFPAFRLLPLLPSSAQHLRGFLFSLSSLDHICQRVPVFPQVEDEESLITWTAHTF